MKAPDLWSYLTSVPPESVFLGCLGLAVLLMWLRSGFDDDDPWSLLCAAGMVTCLVIGFGMLGYGMVVGTYGQAANLPGSDPGAEISKVVSGMSLGYAPADWCIWGGMATTALFYSIGERLKVKTTRLARFGRGLCGVMFVLGSMTMLFGSAGALFLRDYGPQMAVLLNVPNPAP